MDFKKILEVDLKPSSVKLYNIKLNKLHKELGNNANNIKYLLDTKKVMTYLNGLNSNDDKLAYLNAILKVITNKKVADYYKEQRNKFNKIKLDNYKNNVKNDNFIDYQELLKYSPKPNFNDDLEKVINDMVLYISVRYPMRLSLYNIRIARSKKNISNNLNYLYITNKDVKFLMNDFKNIDSMGAVEIEVNEEDKQLIKDYLKFLTNNNVKTEFLLYNYYKGVIPFSSTDMYSRKLKKLLNNIFNADLTMNDIRKSYETNLIQSDKYKTMTNNEKIKQHQKLLHTPFMANLAYNKV